MYLTENVLIETYANKKDLSHAYDDLHRLASHSTTTYEELKRQVEFTFGSPLTHYQREVLDWDYVTHHFWSEREVPIQLRFSPSDFLELKHYGHPGTLGFGRL